MSVVLFFAVVLAVVFLAVFVTGRRVGPLVLTLAAGVLLMQIWANALRVILGGIGLNMPWLPDGALAIVLLVVLPMMMLLFGGPKYHKKHEKLLAALAVTATLAALLVEPLGKYLALAGSMQGVIDQLMAWRPYIITAGMLIGIGDIFLLHTVKTKPGPKKH